MTQTEMLERIYSSIAINVAKAARHSLAFALLITAVIGLIVNIIKIDNHYSNVLKEVRFEMKVLRQDHLEQISHLKAEWVEHRMELLQQIRECNIQREKLVTKVAELSLHKKR